MNVFRKFLVPVVLFLNLLQYAKAQSCNGTCNYNITTNYDFGTYTIAIGEQLCIPAGITFIGTITLNGGTVCNEGILAPFNIVVQSGIINNYGSIRYNGTLTLKAGSYLYNRNNVKLGGALLVNTNAQYKEFSSQAFIVTQVNGLNQDIVYGPTYEKNYGSLDRTLNATYYPVGSDNKLHFKYYNEYTKTNTPLNYNIYNLSHETVGGLPTLNKSYGVNQYSIDLSAVQNLVVGQYYVLEVISDKNEKFYLKFKR